MRRVDADGRPVVVKLLQRHGRETEALATLGRLGHPALVEPAGDLGDLGDLGDGNGRRVVATRLVSGPTLAEMVGRRGPVPVAAAASLLTPVARALAAVHDAGWVHGDVSPTNVVVGPEGAVLLDLGAARPVTATEPVGTPGFTAPEVMAGGPTSPASDVWSLAATFAFVCGVDLDPHLRHPHLGAASSGVPLQRPTATELADAFTALGEAGGGEATGLPQPVAVAADRRARVRARAIAPTRDYGPRPTAVTSTVVPTDPEDRAAGPRIVVVAATAATLAVLATQLVG